MEDFYNNGTMYKVSGARPEEMKVWNSFTAHPIQLNGLMRGTPPGQTCTLDSIEWPDDVIQSCGEVTVEIRIGEKKNQGDTYPIELNGLMMSFQREYVLWIEGSMQGTMEQWRMEQWMDVGVV